MRDQTYKLLETLLTSDPTVSELARERILAAAQGNDSPVAWIGEAEASAMLGLSKSALQQWRRRGTHRTAGPFPFTIMKTAMNTFVYDPAELRQYNAARVVRPPNINTENQEEEKEQYAYA